MTKVWRLICAYFLRPPTGGGWTTLALVGAPILIAITVPDQSGDSAMSWMFDFFRAWLIVAPVFGVFFRSPEVRTQPVTRRQLWTAQWLSSAVGATAIIVPLRLASDVLHGRLTEHTVLITLLLELSCATIGAAAVTASYAPRRAGSSLSLLYARLSAGMLLLVGSPVWSTYLRGLVADSLTSPVAMGLWALTLAIFVAELAFVPSLSKGMPDRWQATALAKRRTDPQTNRFTMPSRSAGRPGKGVEQWVLRRLGWAFTTAVAAVILSALLDAWMPDERTAALTLVQRLAGPYVARDSIGMLLVMSALSWAASTIQNLRILRLVPIARWVLATTLIGGAIIIFSTATAIEMSVYRAEFGVWPANPQFQLVLSALCLTAGAQTAFLAFGRSTRYLPIFIGPPAVWISEGAPTAWTALSLPVTCAIGLGLLIALAFANIILIGRRSALYRPQPIREPFSVVDQPA